LASNNSIQHSLPSGRAQRCGRSLSEGRQKFVRSYECGIVFYPNLGDDGAKAWMTKYARIIEEKGGELTGLDTWGQRKLAYEIDHQSEGIYYFYRFRGDKELLNELGRQLRIDESVLRHLIVKDELAKGDEPKIEVEGLKPSQSGPKEGN
jgi:small subunit ribosomal protein S6